MDYLKEYGISLEQIELLKNGLSISEQKQLEIGKDEVKKSLDYFKSLGIDNLFNIILNRFDLLFCNTEYLENNFGKFDSNFINFIIKEDIQSLINFDI